MSGCTQRWPQEKFARRIDDVRQINSMNEHEWCTQVYTRYTSGSCYILWANTGEASLRKAIRVYSDHACRSCYKYARVRARKLPTCRRISTHTIIIVIDLIMHTSCVERSSLVLFRLRASPIKLPSIEWTKSHILQSYWRGNIYMSVLKKSLIAYR